jgi:hypothetical protein
VAVLVVVAVRHRDRNLSAAKALRRSCASFNRFNVAISRRSIRDQGMEQFVRSRRNLIDCPIESLFVCFGRLGKPAQLADELERRCADFVLSGRRREVMKRSDVSAHGDGSWKWDFGSIR